MTASRHSGLHPAPGDDDPNPKLFDAFSGTYKDAVDGSLAITGLKADYFAEVKVRYLEEIAAASFPSCKSLDVLDFGCGIGASHGLLVDTFPRLQGVDVSPASIAQARARHPAVTYSVYDGLRLPFPDCAFDLAFAICVFHHIPPDRWAPAARELHRVIRPGGRLVVFEHNPHNPLTRWIVDRCPFDADAVLLSGRTTVRLLESAGFDAGRACYILTVPAKSAAMRSVDRRFQRLPLGAQYYVVGIPRAGGPEP